MKFGLESLHRALYVYINTRHVFRHFVFELKINLFFSHFALVYCDAIVIHILYVTVTLVQSGLPNSRRYTVCVFDF